MNQLYVIQDSTVVEADARSRGKIRAESEHRGIVLTEQAELYKSLKSLLLTFIASINPAVKKVVANRELFSPEAMLGTLQKTLRLSGHLGLISQDELHDIRIMQRICDLYSAGSFRQQMYWDTEVCLLMESLRIYRNSKSKFDGVSKLTVFLACQAQLQRRLKDKALALEASPRYGLQFVTQQH